MAKITASEVNELRQKTGAGMMDCKNALTEAGGDMEQALEMLRKKGQKVAAKRGDNEAKEGLIFAKTTDNNASGVLLTLNCETDFVAKNEDFRSFVENLVDIALNNAPQDIDALKNLPYNEKLSVAEKITEQVGIIGEKLDLSAYEQLEGDFVVAYNHPGNQLATLVEFNKAGEKVNEAGKQIAMQVAAMNPIAIKEDQVSEEVINKEIQVGKEQAIEEGKPEDLAEKIAKGKLNKFFKENTLLQQAFVRDNKKTVDQFLKEVEDDLTVINFKRYALS